MMADEVTSDGQVTILVADDTPAIVRMVVAALTKASYRVIVATDGEEALQKALVERPALVVLDVMMPKKSGWEVARALRQNPDTKEVRILMLTAIGSDMNAMTSPLYGADAYLDKPFQFEELLRVIGQLLNESKP